MKWDRRRPKALRNEEFPTGLVGGKPDAARTGPDDAPYEKEHMIKMWTPFSFDEAKYRCFFPRNFLFCFGQRLLLGAIHLAAALAGGMLWGLKIEGREHLKGLSGGFVTVCNHVHILDCVMLSYALRGRNVCFPTLPSNFQIPLIRHIIRLLGAVPLLASKSGLTHTFSQLAGFLKRGGTVHFYPETVLHPYCTELRGFHRGAFVLAEGLRVPVVPVILLFRQGPFSRNPEKRKSRVTLRILPPIYPDESSKGRAGAGRLKQEVFSRMQEERDGFYR